jgi:hypothetical protein
MKLIEGIKAKIADYRQKAANKEEFKQKLFSAIDDGVLTEQEVRELQRDYGSLDLTIDDISKMRVQAYLRLLDRVAADGVVTADEEAELQKLESFLKIRASDIATPKARLHRLRLVSEIQMGNPPRVVAPNVILQKGEVPHWSENASLMEERVVARRYVGGSSGLSFRIAKGVSYRVGASRGQLISDKEIQAVSIGELVVTSQRVVFRGNAKSFAYRLDQLLEVNLFSDGIRLTGSNGKPRTVKFSSGENVDIVGSVLSLSINRFNQ